MKENEILYLVTNKVLIMIDTKKNSDKMEEPIANMIIKVKYNAGYVKENIAENGKYHIFQYMKFLKLSKGSL